MGDPIVGQVAVEDGPGHLLDVALDPPELNVTLSDDVSISAQHARRSPSSWLETAAVPSLPAE